MWILRILGPIKFCKGPIKISNGSLKFGNLHVFEWDMGHLPILRAHHNFGLGLSLNWFEVLNGKSHLAYRGSYMSANVLLNLLNKLGKSDKIRGLQSSLLLFHNKFNKFNNTGARILDSIYRMTLKLIKKSHFWRENVKILPSFRQRYDGRQTVSRKSVNH